MSKIGIKGATWLGMAVALVAMALAIGPGAANATPVPADGKNTMDVVPADSGLQPLGVEFDVELNVVGEGDPPASELAYTVAGAQLEWTDADVDYVTADASTGTIYGFPNAPAPGSGTPVGTEQVIISGLVTATAQNTVGLLATVTLKCAAASSGPDLNGDPDALPDTLLHLVSIAEDPLQGSATAAVAGVPQPMVLEDGLVTCVQAADITTVKTGAGLIEAGGTFDYVVTLTNLGPNAAAGVTLGDNLPETIPDDAAGLLQKIVADTDADTTPDDFEMTVNGAPTPCVPGYLPMFVHPVTSDVILNIVLCDLASVGYSLLQPNDVVVLTITVSVPLWDAGKLNVNTAQGGSLTTYDPDPSNEADCALIPGLDPANIGCDFTQVVPANVDIAKAGVPDPATAGDVITWTIDVDCLPVLGVPASSPCADATGTTGPVITDDVQDNQVGVLTAAFTAGTGSCVINHADASGTDKVLDPDVTCTVTAPMAPGTAVQVEITTQTAGPAVITAPTTCDNDAGVTYADPLTINAPASVVCNPGGCVLCIDKGSGVIPDPIAVLVGESATVTVWEQIEVIDPGANPNLIHTWIASSASAAVSEAWVASGTGTLDFSTGPHATPGLFVISQELEVTCLAATGATAIDIDISGIGLFNDSPTSLEVACYDQPEEVKHPDSGNIWIMEHPNCVDDDGDGRVDEDPVGDASPPSHPDGDPDDDFDCVGDPPTLPCDLEKFGQPGGCQCSVAGGVDEDPGPCNPYEGKASLVIHEIAYAIADTDSPNDSELAKADVIVAGDLTGSMGGEVDAVRTKAAALATALLGLGVDVQVGVVSFEDYNGFFDSSTTIPPGCAYANQYGSGFKPDEPFRVDQAATDSAAAVQLAIGGWTLGDGADGPQSYGRVIWEMAQDDQGLGFRPGATRILVMFLDNLPHDCSLLTTGIDPGRNGVIDFNGDDIDFDGDAIPAAQAAGVTTIVVDSGQGCAGPTPFWSTWADAAVALDTDGSDCVGEPELVDLITQTIEETVVETPEGLGAYEKQVKFDHKLISIEVEDASYLGSTGRAVNCDLTIVTENWVLFGCVSVGSQNGPMSPGPVELSRIVVTPASDLVERIRPTKDNGVVTPLLDENCEWADIYGDPMLGMVGGGLVPVCGDATLTIRMLEGDLNLDCNVDLLDEQAIAFRYGASFGLLLYDQWYDLEPKLTDFDIDIKDLQFVFGRDGSTCDNPIPDQPPSPPIP